MYPSNSSSGHTQNVLKTEVAIPDVEAQMNWLGLNVESIHEQLNRLEDRLIPILRPLPKTSSGGHGSETASSSSPLVDSLAEKNFHLEQARVRISDLLDRLTI